MAGEGGLVRCRVGAGGEQGLQRLLTGQVDKRQSLGRGCRGIWRGRRGCGLR